MTSFFNRHRYYILQDRVPVSVPMEEFILHGRYRQDGLGDDEWRVAEDYVFDTHISTVFLGLDHAFGKGPPILFETMVFRDGEGEECWRCSTWDEAERQHAAAVSQIRRERIAN